VQRECLSTTTVAASLDGSVVNLRIGRLLGSWPLAEPLRTLHHRARCMLVVSFCIASAVLKHFVIYVLLCNSRTDVITLLLGYVCDVLCIIASVMATHDDPAYG
jgi:hypothetical protein